jgi:hypothetical protein
LALPLLFGACSFAVKPTPVAVQDRPPIKEAAHHFVAALAAGDESAISNVTTVDRDPGAQRLAASVRKDAAIARQLQVELTRRFDITDVSAAQVGSEAWLGNFMHLADDSVMLQVDRRARIGDETTDGVVFLRQVAGEWKVELIPTLVAESGGRVVVTDPSVQYRYDVAVALNEMLLQRLERGEFETYQDYQHARNEFWAQYLTVISNGQEPHDKLLATLPYVPKEPEMVADTR